MRMWSQFATRQKQRFVPIPPDANRRVLPETQGGAMGSVAESKRVRGGISSTQVEPWSDS
jgi:hypothetical protein